MGKGNNDHCQPGADISSLLSTNFMKQHGRLAEQSEIKCDLPGAQLWLEEVPQSSIEFKEALSDLFPKIDTADGLGWEMHLELPYPEDPLATLEITLDRSSRDRALKDGQALQARLIADQLINQPCLAQILSYPGLPGSGVPAMLWTDLRLEGVGDISVISSADTIQEALRAMQTLLPQASTNS